MISEGGAPDPAPNLEGHEVRALEALIIGNPDLDELELLLSEFNMFEAVGMVRQELRHSEFLAFLLDPNQNHGLGDAFVTRLLQTVLLAARGAALPVSPLDLDVWSLDEVAVQREWQHIDILLVDESHRLVVVIENKVDSSEHSDQLARYHDIVRRAHADKSFFGIYLTPDGAAATHPSYLSCSYGMIATAIADLMESRRSTMGEDVRTVLRHYHQMLHRHIMSESRIAELCQRIYRKHQRALDLIFEHRPDLQSAISAHLRQLINETPGLRSVGEAKAMVRFTADQWDGITALESSACPTGRLIFLEFHSAPDRLGLAAYLGPGPQAKRAALLDLARHGEILRPGRKLGNQWNTLRSWSFLKPAAYESASAGDLIDQVSERWDRWVREELPGILEDLSAAKISAALDQPLSAIGS